MKDAPQILRSGGLVAFPTETVYGLGADATNAAAVKRIFLVKGRLLSNPLIVHVVDALMAQRYASDWPAAADRLATAFWPGPLAMIVPKSNLIVDEATAGRQTVALRAPDHPIALELLREFGGPIAAPSANRSMRISPTTAEHVRRELGERVDLILDGGPCRVGIESTVLDLTPSRPVILRPGGISRQQIEAVIGHVDLFRGRVDEGKPAASPGQQAVHYSPQKPSYRFEARDLQEVVDHWRRSPQRIAILCMRDQAVINQEFSRAIVQPHVIHMPAGEAPYAHRLYAALREADDSEVSSIWIEMPPDEAHWYAVRDRITRATQSGSDFRDLAPFRREDLSLE
ncbi:MAG: L-threonylcarbamoyladenylate synthase [Planctomycetota bacterium]|nr:L-threonylcarbamoyladenylate synthase [Planctomycetota bacterium]